MGNHKDEAVREEAGGGRVQVTAPSNAQLPLTNSVRKTCLVYFVFAATNNMRTGHGSCRVGFPSPLGDTFSHSFFMPLSSSTVNKS